MTERLTFAAKVTSEGRNIRGAVQLAGQRNRRGNEWVEVDPIAVMNADASKTIGVFEHDDRQLLGTLENGTLSFNRTPEGIEYVISNLPNTTAANDALELVRGGYVTGSSFQIDGFRSKFSVDPHTGERTRRIYRIDRLVDVSPVRAPFFEASSAMAFSKGENMADDDKTPEAEKADEAPPKREGAKFAGGETADSPKTGADEWAATAEAFSTEQIEATMDSIFKQGKGDLKGELLDRYEGFAKVLQGRKKADAETRGRIERMEALHNLRLGRVPKAPEMTQFTGSDEYREAFGQYLRTGDKGHIESFAQSIAGDGTQGGYAVPDGFLNRITESQLAYGGIAGVSDSITTSDGQPLRWPSNDDTANSAVIAAEGSAAGSGGADLVFGSVTLGAYSYDATGASNLPLLVSKELLQDAAFDIEGFIARKLGERIGRKQAADFATGNGSSKPYGLLSKTPDTMTATTMFAAVIEHIFQVDAAYRNSGNARWVLSDTTLAKAYASVDGNGRPLFIAASDASAAGRPTGFIMGYPVTIDNGAGDLVAFGDINLGYIIRYVRGVQIDVDPYTNIKSRQVAYHAWARADANIQDTAAYSVSDYSTVSADS